MMRPLVALVVLTLLSGCSGGGQSSLAPYVIGAGEAPEGYKLMDDESPYWESFAKQFGMDSNPGPADVSALPDVDEDEADDAPRPCSLYVSLWVSEDSGGDEYGEGMIMSMAARMCSDADAEEAFHSEDMCQDEETSDDDGFGIHLLRDGRVFAIVMGIGAEGVDLDDSVAAIEARTGAESICEL